MAQGRSATPVRIIVRVCTHKHGARVCEETHLSAAKVPLGALAIRLISDMCEVLNCGDWV